MKSTIIQIYIYVKTTEKYKWIYWSKAKVPYRCYSQLLYNICLLFHLWLNSVTVWLTHLLISLKQMSIIDQHFTVATGWFNFHIRPWFSAVRLWHLICGVNEIFGVIFQGLVKITGHGNWTLCCSGSSGGLVVRIRSRHNVITANMSIQSD